ncbi:MAG: GIY-YIG nuclease family protein [Acidaminococcus sp.]|nr:GIY-YIG nuclease family protein [Acidaminococcus sp.]MCI2116768.1 GIY-YIG nuclease family protein [Acidaminococcus sp.]
MTAYVYMVRCANGHLYTGWTTDLAARLKAHQSGKGARYTRGFKAVSMVYYESLPDKSAALKREYAIKQLTKTQKEDMVAHFTGTLPAPVSPKKNGAGSEIK